NRNERDEEVQASHGSEVGFHYGDHGFQEQFLRKEAVERRKAGHRKCCNDCQGEGNRQDGKEAAKAFHAPCAGFMVDDAGDHEQCTLECCMVDRMEYRCYDSHCEQFIIRACCEAQCPESQETHDEAEL